MRIIKIAVASDLERAYDGLKEALKQLDGNNIGATKREIQKAIKNLERERPHLKTKGRPVRRKI
jgi:hypothetical protein